MAQEEIKKSLRMAASSGRRELFDELASQLDDTDENFLFINLCGEMINKLPSAMYDD